MKRDIKNITALADYVEKCRLIFNMAVGFVEPDCGSAGCLGAHAARKWPDLRQYYRDGSYSWIGNKLNARFGITESQSDMMFFECPNANGNDLYCSHVTKPMAVAMLRRFAKTGRIYFSKRDQA